MGLLKKVSRFVEKTYLKQADFCIIGILYLMIQAGNWHFKVPG